MEGGGRRRWCSSLVGGGSLCPWGLMVHPWGIIVVGERVAAVPGLCCARLVVAVVVFVCARGRCHVRAGRRHARAGLLWHSFWLLLWSSVLVVAVVFWSFWLSCWLLWLLWLWSFIVLGRGHGHSSSSSRGGDVAHRCCVGVVAEAGRVAVDVGPTRRLAHGGRSRHVAATWWWLVMVGGECVVTVFGNGCENNYQTNKH